MRKTIYSNYHFHLKTIILYSLWHLIPSENISQGDGHDRRASTSPYPHILSLLVQALPSISISFMHIWGGSGLVASVGTDQLRVPRLSPAMSWPLFFGKTTEWPKIEDHSHATITTILDWKCNVKCNKELLQRSREIRYYFFFSRFMKAAYNFSPFHSKPF